MKVAVISSSMYPDEFSWRVAQDFTGLYEVTFFAPPGIQDGNFNHLIIPCSYGEVSPKKEGFPYRWYRDFLLNQNLVVDASQTCQTVQELYFWEDNRNCPQLVFVAHVRNGELSRPHPPVCQEVLCLVFDRKSKEAAVEEGIPEENIREVKGQLLRLKP